MYDEFISSEDADILVELAYIFVQVVLNAGSDRLKLDLAKSFERARKMNEKNF